MKQKTLLPHFTSLILALSISDLSIADASAPPSSAPSSGGTLMDTSGPIVPTEPTDSLPVELEPIEVTSEMMDREEWEKIHPSDGIYWPGYIDPEQNYGETGDENCAGNPINIATGNKFQIELDIQKIVETDLELSRTYNSLRPVHWTHTYSSYIVLSGRRIKLVKSDGSSEQFEMNTTRNQAHAISAGEGTFTKIGDKWAHQDLNLDTSTFDSKGRLIRWQSHNGYHYTIRHSDNYNVEITNSLGKKITLTHDYFGRLNKAISKTHQIQYNYDRHGRLIGVSKTIGGKTVKRQYLYEDTKLPFHLTGIIDERGIRFATWSYGSRGRAISSEHAGFEKITLAYDDGDFTTVVTNSLGKKTTHYRRIVLNEYRLVRIEGHASANCPLSNKNFTYDEQGNVISITDENGIETRFSYNSHGLEISRTEAYGTASERIITTQRDVNGIKPVRINEPGKITIITYDTQGRLLEKTEQGS